MVCSKPVVCLDERMMATVEIKDWFQATFETYQSKLYKIVDAIVLREMATQASSNRSSKVQDYCQWDFKSELCYALIIQPINGIPALLREACKRTELSISVRESIIEYLSGCEQDFAKRLQIFVIGCCCFRQCHSLFRIIPQKRLKTNLIAKAYWELGRRTLRQFWSKWKSRLQIRHTEKHA
jgi:hypothetical protein